MNKKSVLIVGGSSYIGLKLTDFLSANFDVTTTYCNTAIVAPDVKAIHLDLLDKSCFSSLAHKCFDVVVWCAQSSNYRQSIDNYSDMFNVNVQGMQKTLEFCRVTGVKRFIYLSSGTVYKNPGTLQFLHEESEISMSSYYGSSKYAAEKMCHHYASKELDITILRPFTVYGPGQTNKIIPRLWQKIRNDQPVNLNGGMGMSFTGLYIDDLVAIIKYFIDHSNSNNPSIFNVANPELLNLQDICIEIGRLENLTVHIQNIDEPVTYSIADVKKLKSTIPLLQFTSIHEGLLEMSKRAYKCVG